jgi:hypothetical protein
MNQIKSLFTLTPICFLLFACGENTIHYRLKNDATINRVFNRSEINDLLRIVEFTDSIVTKQSPAVNIDSAYHIFIDSIRVRAVTRGSLIEALDQDIKYNFIFSLNHNLVRNIWNTDSTARKIKYKDTILTNLNDFPRLDLSCRGKFMDYTKLVGKRYPAYKELHYDVSMCGHLSSGLRVGYIKKHHKLNFNILENRLWIAIFILTLEEPIDKKVERYLKHKFMQKTSSNHAVNKPLINYIT